MGLACAVVVEPGLKIIVEEIRVGAKIYCRVYSVHASHFVHCAKENEEILRP